MHKRRYELGSCHVVIWFVGKGRTDTEPASAEIESTSLHQFVSSKHTVVEYKWSGGQVKEVQKVDDEED